MHWTSISGCLLTVAVILAGCADSQPTEEGAMADGGEPPQSKPGAPIATGTNATPASAEPLVVMNDCTYVYGFMPVPWDAAQAIVGDAYRPFSWTFPGHEDFASVMVHGAACDNVRVGNETLGAAASFWILPSIEQPDGARSDENQFLAYSLHSHEELADVWGQWGSAGVGSLRPEQGLDRATALVLESAELTGTVSVAEPGALTGVVSGFWDLYSADGAAVAFHYNGAFGSLGGVLEVALPIVPLDLGGARVVPGFGNGHGPLSSITIQPITS